jgi:putative ABC transport system substrate-binding protein
VTRLAAILLPAAQGEGALPGDSSCRLGDLDALHERAALYIDKLLKGVRAADLPVEQPTEFELAVNLKTARALGLTLSQPILVRADEIIHP